MIFTNPRLCIYIPGTNREIIMTNLMFPHRLTIYQDSVYWSDVWYSTLRVANKYTGSNIQTLYENRGAPGGTIYDIKIHDRNQTRCKFRTVESVILDVYLLLCLDFI